MRTVFLVVLLNVVTPVSVLAAENPFQVLAYHDVRDIVADDFDSDQYAISTANLIDHFTWLKLNDFNVVSVDDILAAQRGEHSLPDRAVLITFDDGLKSVATHVLPLLELFDYPAVVSIVTNWIESDPGVSQGGRMLTRDDFLTWDQLQELAAHELIEIGSHSHDLHRGITGNPQGNEQPAGITARFADGSYESAKTYAARLRRDLATSIERIEAAVGFRPRVMTWPFGAFSEITIGIAVDLGMDVMLTLGDGSNTAADLSSVTRHLIEANPGVDELGWSLLYPEAAQTIRAAQVDLDYVYDEDPVQQEENLGRLLDRIKAMGITHVFLQAFADPDADGGAQALYFPNRYLPMRADLFNRVAWQLKTRSDVLVFAWLPILSFEGEAIDPAWRVMQRTDGKLIVDSASEPRLSPFSSEAREIINGIYADLARHADFDGLLFHDDGRFNEFEDASPAALEAYRERFGTEFDFGWLASDPDLSAEWARFRSQALIDLSQELAATVRRYRPDIETARNLFATALLEPAPELRLGQSYEAFLDAYDYVAIMAMPHFEGYENTQRFYESLAALSSTPAGYREKLIFELQTVDWTEGKPIDSIEIRDTMRMLQSLGIRNLAYYPDDFIGGHPDVRALRQGMSVAVFPPEAAR